MRVLFGHETVQQAKYTVEKINIICAESILSWAEGLPEAKRIILSGSIESVAYIKEVIAKLK